ncbi:MAG TPA: hypothetical protein PKC21_04365 [Oligoflexia bacterium]|nr:hypothetical protein [Oligoflexia bacterium]HMR24573.1 hypothetical protein [Oligoflexia bacterium]
MKSVQLAQKINQIIKLLRSCDEKKWSKKLKAISVTLENEGHGLQTFLSCFGSMGSLNDFSLLQYENASIDDEKKFRRLIHEAYSITKEK